jgi:hypothetical protein
MQYIFASQKNKYFPMEKFIQSMRARGITARLFTSTLTQRRFLKKTAESAHRWLYA